MGPALSAPTGASEVGLGFRGSRAHRRKRNTSVCSEDAAGPTGQAGSRLFSSPQRLSRDPLPGFSVRGRRVINTERELSKQHSSTLFPASKLEQKTVSSYLPYLSSNQERGTETHVLLMYGNSSVLCAVQQRRGIQIMTTTIIAALLSGQRCLPSAGGTDRPAEGLAGAESSPCTFPHSSRSYI